MVGRMGKRTRKHTILRIIGVEYLGEPCFVFRSQGRQADKNMLFGRRHDLVGGRWHYVALAQYTSVVIVSPTLFRGGVGEGPALKRR